VKVLETVQFSARLLDADGNVIDLPVMWSATGGSVNNVGIFSSYDPGTFTVTAAYGSVSSNLDITVIEDSSADDDDSSDDDAESEKESDFPVVAIIAPILILVIAVVLIVLLLMRKKRSSEEEETGEETDEYNALYGSIEGDATDYQEVEEPEESFPWE
jgi:hypothetical protein